VHAQVATLGKGEVELLVVDDRSEDRSAELAREFLSLHGLAGRVITTERNQGPSDARNLGWRSAAAEWIQFLDADDLLAPQKLQIQYTAATSAEDDVAVLYSPWQRMAREGGQWKPHGPIVRSNVDEDSLLRILADSEFGYVGPTLIRRHALEVVDGFSSGMALGEDFDLMLRIAMCGLRFRNVAHSEPLFFYRTTPDSLWHRSDANLNAARRLVRAIRTAELYAREAHHGVIPASTRPAIGSRYAQRLEILRSGDRAEFDQVLDWISELHLRSAPDGSGRPAQLLARILGLSSALRVKFALRHLAESAGHLIGSPSSE
jgi:glycosyltransferase involved in cell wall biosynthesis